MPGTPMRGGARDAGLAMAAGCDTAGRSQSLPGPPAWKIYIMVAGNAGPDLIIGAAGGCWHGVAVEMALLHVAVVIVGAVLLVVLDRPFHRHHGAGAGPTRSD